jgi:hypothetical protein
MSSKRGGASGRAILTGCLACVTAALLTTACGGSSRSVAPDSSPPVKIRVAADAARVLRGRLLAIYIGSRDVWVLAHGRLVSGTANGRQLANKRVGEDFYTDVSSFSLSPDAHHLTFVADGNFLIPGSPPPVLLVSRPDGSGVHSLGRGLCQSALCEVSLPSWDRNGHSFVISLTSSLNQVERYRIFRVPLNGSRPVPLPPSKARLSENTPVVSPNGKQIAFLGSDSGVGPGHYRESVYVMDANGKARIRLPLPARAYGDLWWCGNSTTLCADVPGQSDCNLTYTACPTAAFRNTFQVSLRSGRVMRRRHWRQAQYALLSHDATFALTTRKTSQGWQLLGGPMSGRAAPRLSVLLLAPHAKADPFHDFSISGD